MELNPYILLGVQGTASEAEIRKAYRKKMLIFHRDKIKDLREDEKRIKDEQFENVTKALDILTKVRHIYDDNVNGGWDVAVNLLKTGESAKTPEDFLEEKWANIWEHTKARHTGPDFKSDDWSDDQVTNRQNLEIEFWGKAKNEDIDSFRQRRVLAYTQLHYNCTTVYDDITEKAKRLIEKQDYRKRKIEKFKARSEEKQKIRKERMEAEKRQREAEEEEKKRLKAVNHQKEEEERTRLPEKFKLEITKDLEEKKKKRIELKMIEAEIKKMLQQQEQRQVESVTNDRIAKMELERVKKEKLARSINGEKVTKRKAEEMKRQNSKRQRSSPNNSDKKLLVKKAVAEEATVTLQKEREFFHKEMLIKQNECRLWKCEASKHKTAMEKAERKVVYWKDKAMDSEEKQRRLQRDVAVVKEKLIVAEIEVEISKTKARENENIVKKDLEESEAKLLAAEHETRTVKEELTTIKENLIEAENEIKRAMEEYSNERCKTELCRSKAEEELQQLKEELQESRARAAAAKIEAKNVTSKEKKIRNKVFEAERQAQMALEELLSIRQQLTDYKEDKDKESVKANLEISQLKAKVKNYEEEASRMKADLQTEKKNTVEGQTTALKREEKLLNQIQALRKELEDMRANPNELTLPEIAEPDVNVDIVEDLVPHSHELDDDDYGQQHDLDAEDAANTLDHGDEDGMSTNKEDGPNQNKRVKETKNKKRKSIRPSHKSINSYRCKCSNPCGNRIVHHRKMNILLDRKYSCGRCGYTTNRSDTFARHKKRKRICKLRPSTTKKTRQQRKTNA